MGHSYKFMMNRSKSGFEILGDKIRHRRKLLVNAFKIGYSHQLAFDHEIYFSSFEGLYLIIGDKHFLFGDVIHTLLKDRSKKWDSEELIDELPKYVVYGS